MSHTRRVRDRLKSSREGGCFQVMGKRMKVLIAYDGSGYADAALDDLRRAGLPGDAEALVVSVADGLVNVHSPVEEVMP
jgi:hypothetical protein